MRLTGAFALVLAIGLHHAQTAEPHGFHRSCCRPDIPGMGSIDKYKMYSFRQIRIRHRILIPRNIDRSADYTVGDGRSSVKLRTYF